MISYDPFWKTIQERNISTYQLIGYGILPDTIQRLRSGKPITTKTLNNLCIAINCTIPDILEFVPDADENEK
ncbi:MAG: helix-turn-helix domain-containing protein [Lachnospiraceae bacterium]